MGGSLVCNSIALVVEHQFWVYTIKIIFATSFERNLESFYNGGMQRWQKFGPFLRNNQKLPNLKIDLLIKYYQKKWLFKKSRKFLSEWNYLKKSKFGHFCCLCISAFFKYFKISFKPGNFSAKIIPILYIYTILIRMFEIDDFVFSSGFNFGNMTCQLVELSSINLI